LATKMSSLLKSSYRPCCRSGNGKEIFTGRAVALAKETPSLLKALPETCSTISWCLLTSKLIRSQCLQRRASELYCYGKFWYHHWASDRNMSAKKETSPLVIVEVQGPCLALFSFTN